MPAGATVSLPAATDLRVKSLPIFRAWLDRVSSRKREIESTRKANAQGKVMNDKFDELAKGLVQSITRQGALHQARLCCAIVLGIAWSFGVAAATFTDAN